MVNLHASDSEQFFNISITQSEPQLEINYLKNNRFWKSLMLIHSDGVRFPPDLNHHGITRLTLQNRSGQRYALTEVVRSFKFKKANKLIHQALVSRLLKDDTKSRSNEVKKLQSEILKQEDRIQRLQNNLADGIIESEDYLSMKNRFRESKRNAEERLYTMRGDHTGKEELLRKVVNAIDTLVTVYYESNSTDKTKILGSIFPEMIEFDGIKYRTPKINEAILLCLNADKGFGENKSGTIHEKMELSRLVGDEGEKSNLFKEFEALLCGLET